MPAKWHLIPSNGFSRVHACARRHTDRRMTDHDTITRLKSKEKNALYITGRGVL